MTDSPWELFKGGKPKKTRKRKPKVNFRIPPKASQKPQDGRKTSTSYKGTPWTDMVSRAKIGTLVMRSNPSYRYSGSRARSKADIRIASNPGSKHTPNHYKKREE